MTPFSECAIRAPWRLKFYMAIISVFPQTISLVPPNLRAHCNQLYIYMKGSRDIYLDSYCEVTENCSQQKISTNNPRCKQCTAVQDLAADNVSGVHLMCVKHSYSWWCKLSRGVKQSQCLKYYFINDLCMPSLFSAIDSKIYGVVYPGMLPMVFYEMLLSLLHCIIVTVIRRVKHIQQLGQTSSSFSLECVMLSLH